MPRKHKRVPGCRPYKNWSEETLQKAINEIKAGSLSLRDAQDKFRIPKSSLQRKINYLNMGKVGRPSELDFEEEEKLVEGLWILADWGCPITSFELRLLVKAYLDAKGSVCMRFKNNLPGLEWSYSFLERHKKKLTSRLCSNIKRARAEISKQDIEGYFENLSNSTIGVPPECIVNYDETNVSDDPGRKKVLVRRGSKRVDRVIDHSKSSTSVMFAGTATGVMLPPYIVYKAEHLHTTWTSHGPPDTRYNRSRSGWFDSIIFEDWFNNLLMPYFSEIDRQEGRGTLKLIIGDNLSSYVSLSIIKTCEENNIRFVFLPPNSTHLCQPLDVAFFRGFKESWRKVLTEWKLKFKGTVSKDKFPFLLRSTLNAMGDRIESSLISGFRSCGIYPHDPNAVLKKLQKDRSSEQSSSANAWSEAFVDMMKKSREKEPTVKQRKKRLNVKPGESVTEHHFDPVPGMSGTQVEVVMCRSDDESDKLNLSDDTIFSDHEAANDPLIFDNIETIDHQGNGSDDEENVTVIPVNPENKDIDKDDTENTDTNNLLIKDNDFVLVRLTYNRDTKKPVKKFFIAKITEVLSEKITCKFMRKSQKTENTFIFPVIEDEMVIDKEQIIKTLSLPNIKRGHHIFAGIEHIMF